MRRFLTLLLAFAWTASGAPGGPVPYPTWDPQERLAKLDGFELDQVNINEIMSKLGSLTVLSCNPVFGSAISDKEALWYKDGSPVASVTGERNAVYLDRPLEGVSQNIPEVGFLIIPQMEMRDEGDYWCIRKDNHQFGEITRLRIAFLTPLDEAARLVASTTSPKNGDFVEIQCAQTDAFPAAAISWHFNGDPLPVGSSLEVVANGSLMIHRFTQDLAGTYDCVLQNFAGKTKASVDLRYAGERLPGSMEDQSNNYTGFRRPESFALLKNGGLWFLLGCLSTCCLVLTYLFAGMICNRHQNRRPTTGTAPLWKRLIRADPALAPGFRKVIAPVSDPSQPPLISRGLY